MKKKSIVIGAIIVVVLAIGLCVFLGIRNSNCKYQDLGSICSIKYSDGKDEYELIKEKKSWKWEDREDLPVDQELVKAQVKMASKALRITKTEDSGSLKKYGLDKPEYSLTLKDTLGRKITIHIGDMVSDDTYFVRIGNKKDIYTASNKIMDVVDSLLVQRTVSEQMEIVGE